MLRAFGAKAIKAIRATRTTRDIMVTRATKAIRALNWINCKGRIVKQIMEFYYFVVFLCLSERNHKIQLY